MDLPDKYIIVGVMLYLSENLKKYRVQKNLTQEDIAEYLGVTPQSVSKWER